MGAEAARSGCAQSPQLADVASDMQQRRPRGLSSTSTGPRRRASASRRPPSTTRSTMRSASASSRPSSPSRNQYRVILEADPALQHVAATRCARSTCHRRRIGSRRGARCRCPRSPRVTERRSPLLITHLGQFPATTISFNLAPGALARRRRAATSSRREAEIGLPASFVTSFQGAALAFQASLGNELLLVLAAIVDHVHRAGRALRELHPSDHDPLDAAVGRRRRAAGADDRRATTSTSSASSASCC